MTMSGLQSRTPESRLNHGRLIVRTSEALLPHRDAEVAVEEGYVVEVIGEIGGKRSGPRRHLECRSTRRDDWNRPSGLPFILLDRLNNRNMSRHSPELTSYKIDMRSYPWVVNPYPRSGKAEKIVRHTRAIRSAYAAHGRRVAKLAAR